MRRRTFGMPGTHLRVPYRTTTSSRSHEIEESNTMERRVQAMRASIVKAIRTVSRGYVSSYGEIAKAAGHPGAARQVVGILRTSFDLPWHRIVGAGGEIKLRGDSAIEQRLRLEAEGVTFRGRRVNMRRHEFRFPGRKGKRTPAKKASKTTRK